MALNPAITGILDETSPGLDLFEGAEGFDTASEPLEQTPAETAPAAQAVDAEIADPTGVAPVEAPVESSKFSFAGRDWDSQTAAENDFKSWEGRIQAEQGKVRDYEKRINEYWEYVQAVSKENDEYRAQTQPVAATKEPKSDVPAVDFDQIGRLMEIARNQGMDPMSVGMRAYAAQAEKVYEHKLNERLAAVERPLEDIQNATAEQTADREMFLWAQGLKGDNGAPAFPDLQANSLNEDLVLNVHRVWKQLSREFGPKYAYSAPGFDYAYRLAKDLTPARAAAHPVSGETARDAQGRFLSTAAAAAASDITGNQPNPTRPKTSKSSTQEMLEELSAVKTVKIGGTDLGFFE